MRVWKHRPRRPSPDPSPLSEAGGRALQFCHLFGCHCDEGVAGGEKFGVQFGFHRRAALLAGADRMFGKVFSGRILPFDEEAARAFPEIAARRRAQGRPIAEFDAQIAAIARSRRATLATRSTADFDGCGVRLANPWQA
jgi:hypothetical protein